jgi:hypothetical protein
VWSDGLFMRELRCRIAIRQVVKMSVVGIGCRWWGSGCSDLVEAYAASSGLDAMGLKNFCGRCLERGVVGCWVLAVPPCRSLGWERFDFPLLNRLWVLGSFVACSWVGRSSR